MKTAEWKRTARPVLPTDGNWEFRGPLSYRLPVHRVLFGVLGEGSGFDKGIYIWRVVMPLFVPAENVALSWSARIGGGARKFGNFSKDDLAAAIAEAAGGLPVNDEEALGEMVSRGFQAGPNRRVHEVVGYAQVLLGNVAAAEESLARAKAGTARTPWEEQIIERAELISRALDEGGRDQAVGQLDTWCSQTVAALGLRRLVAKVRTISCVNFRSPPAFPVPAAAAARQSGRTTRAGRRPSPPGSAVPSGDEDGPNLPLAPG